MDELRTEINLYSELKFEIEKENVNTSMSKFVIQFLNYFCHVQNRKLNFEIFKKHGWNRITDNNDHCPNNWKINCIFNKILTIKNNSSNEEIEERTLDEFFAHVVNCGYNRQCISEILNKANSKLTESKRSKIDYLKQEKVLIKIPYGHHKLANEILNTKKQIGFITKRNIHVIFQQRKIMSYLSMNQKYNLPKELVSNLVYSCRCVCGKTYIGETKPRLIERIKSHTFSNASAIREHLDECTLFKNDFEKFCLEHTLNLSSPAALQRYLIPNFTIRQDNFQG